jgi:multiple sugar transport system ATP-binding protein
MAALILKKLSKLYGDDVIGVRDLNIEVPEGELMVLVGPSGSGKSTTLRLVAGLERPTGGEVLIDGRLANDLPPRDRDVAMVFQDYALYPHLNVEQNLGFGLKMRRTPSSEVRSRVAEVSHMLGIDDLLRRKPRELSGGQRQRVALGRALVRDPKVFLFDEPLSNLDASLRVQLRREIKELHRKLGATILYVTHDQTEAMALGRCIVVMNEGTVEQIGTPEEIYRRPESKFVAGFFGSPSMNLITCSATMESGALRITQGEATHSLQCEMEDDPDSLGPDVFVGFRPEDVVMGAPQGTEAFGARARVAFIEAMGAESLVYLEADGFDLVARVLGHVDVEAEGAVEFIVPLERLHLFNVKTGRRIIVK